MSEYLLAKDTVNGASGSVVITVNGQNRVISGMKNIQTSVNIQSSDMRVIGTKKIQSKPNGGQQTGKGNIYYGFDEFRRMALRYVNEGILDEFTIQINNDDPATSIGSESIVYYGCHLTGEIPISILNDEESMLNFDFNFNYTKAVPLSSFRAPAQLGSD